MVIIISNNSLHSQTQQQPSNPIASQLPRVVSFREGLTNARKDHTMNINEISLRLWLAQKILHNCEWQLQASLLSTIL
jgi:hypothetical protein